MSSEDGDRPAGSGVGGRARWRGDEPRLKAAFAVSSTGDWIFRFALPLLVLEQTGSATLASLTYAVEYLPFLVFGLVSGVVADRLDRRRLIIGCDAASAVVMVVLTVICLSGRVNVPAVLALTFVLSSVRPVHFPAFQGLLTMRVPVSRRAPVNAWVQGADSFLSLLGPVAGAAAVAFLGPAAACGLNAVSFGLSAVLVSGLSVPRTAGTTMRAALRAAVGAVRPDMVAGMRALAADGSVLWGTVLLTVTNFGLIGVQANLAYLTGGPTGSGSRLAMTLVAQGSGALIGAAFTPALLRRWRIGTVVTAGMGAIAVALAAPGVLPEAHHMVVLPAALFLSGFAASVVVVPWRTHRQNVVPEAYMGRVVAVQRTVGFALGPVGAVAGGFTVSHFGGSALFLAAATIQAVVWLCALRGPVGRAGAAPASVTAPSMPSPRAHESSASRRTIR